MENTKGQLTLFDTFKPKADVKEATLPKNDVCHMEKGKREDETNMKYLVRNYPALEYEWERTEHSLEFRLWHGVVYDIERDGRKNE